MNLYLMEYLILLIIHFLESFFSLDQLQLAEGTSGGTLLWPIYSFAVLFFIAFLILTTFVVSLIRGKENKSKTHGK